MGCGSSNTYAEDVPLEDVREKRESESPESNAQQEEVEKEVVEEEPVEALKWTESERAFVNIWKDNNLTKSGDNDDMDYGECAVCFEPLSENRPTVMQDAEENRACRHFICYECAEDLLDSTKTCPLCRRTFEAIAELPSLLQKKDEWFELVAGDHKKLTRQDVLLVLNAILPIPSSRIGTDIGLEWSKWDPEEAGHLTKEQVEKSIYPYVQRKINMPRFQKGNIPDISKPENVGLWFDYWDWDNRGRLAKHEIARAMLKTFSQLLQGQRGKLVIKQMSQTLLLDFWPVLELQDTNYIELDEFIAEDGLAQCIMQLLRDTMNKPPDTADLIDMGFDPREYQISPRAKKENRVNEVKRAQVAQAPEEEQFVKNIDNYAKKNPDSGLLSRPSLHKRKELLDRNRLLNFGIDANNLEDQALVSMLTTDETEDPPPIEDLIGKDSLPRWWMRRISPAGEIFYQNNFTHSTSWEPPTREQYMQEYRNGAGRWYRDRFCQHESNVMRRIGDRRKKGRSLANRERMSENKESSIDDGGLLEV